MGFAGARVPGRRGTAHMSHGVEGNQTELATTGLTSPAHPQCHLVTGLQLSLVFSGEALGHSLCQGSSLFPCCSAGRSGASLRVSQRPECVSALKRKQAASVALVNAAAFWSQKELSGSAGPALLSCLLPLWLLLCPQFCLAGGQQLSSTPSAVMSVGCSLCEAPSGQTPVPSPALVIRAQIIMTLST